MDKIVIILKAIKYKKVISVFYLVFYYNMLYFTPITFFYYFIVNSYLNNMRLMFGLYMIKLIMTEFNFIIKIIIQIYIIIQQIF